MGFGSGGGSGSVAGSSDVALNSPANNQVLTYDSSIAKWKNGTGGSGVDAEGVRDTIAATLVGGTNITVAPNDAADTITVSTPATVNSPDATLLARANHTGTQPTSTITDLDDVLLQTIKRPVSWAASTPYLPGDFFIKSSTVYRVINAFTSGTVAPIPGDAQPETSDADFEVYASPSAVGTSVVRRASDGSATFGRVYSLISPTADTELTNKQYVDEAVDAVTLPTRPASILSIVWNGSAWTYRGSVISAQPTDRISGDVAMFIGNPGGSLPTWAVTNDIWTQG